MLPMKKAMTVVMTAEVVVFAKRVKFGVALPPETKLPMTRPIAVTVVIPWFCPKTAWRPPPSFTAAIIE